MRRRGRLTLALMGFVLGTAVTSFQVYGQVDTSVHVKAGPEPEVRYASGRTIYLEALVGDRWVGRYWSPDGRINYNYELYADDAFGLQIEDKWLSGGWQWVGASEAPRTARGARHFVVELSSALRPVRVKVHTLLDGTPVLVRWLEITNTSSKPISLSAVYPWSGRLWRFQTYVPKKVEEAFSLGYFTEIRQMWEGWLRWRAPLEDQTTRVECRVGQGFNDPFFIARNLVKGEYFIGHLAWSANWEMLFDTERAGGRWGHQQLSLLFKIGPWASIPQRVIAPGETIRTPAVHLGHVAGDLDTAVQAMHDHLRRFVLPPRKPERSYLVQYSVPADQGYFRGADSFTETNLFKSIDVAAAIGTELFIVDYGWWDIAGDWFTSPGRFPHGLEAVADYARKKGMLFGLYVESEGGRGKLSESKMGKAHPDWLVTPRQIVNLSKPEAAAWVESEIVRLIERYKLDLYRLDFNPIFTDELSQTRREGFEENDYWRYYEAFYGMYERIKAKYPDVILQQCAAGGGRNDLGTVSRFDEPYLTDGLEMPHVLQNYSGQTLALPPENFVIGLGEGTHMVRGGGLSDTHLRATFTLSTPWILNGPAPTVEELNPQLRERYLHYAHLYKKFIRPLWPTAKMYHHAPATANGGVTSSPWFAVEFASPDRAQGWATVIRLREEDPDTYRFIPRGLERSKTYRVTFDSTGETATVSGLELMREGLPLRLESALSSELLLFEAQ